MDAFNRLFVLIGTLIKRISPSNVLRYTRYGG